jgi:hypothetical protein
MISKILAIANASRLGSVLILDAFQMIQKRRPSVKAIFISPLSELSKKNLGPNAMNSLIKEERESLERAKKYFTRMDIPYKFKVITGPPWQAVLTEVKCGDQDLIILQGKFLKIWREDTLDDGLCFQAIFRLNCPILMINPSEETLLSTSF